MRSSLKYSSPIRTITRALCMLVDESAFVNGCASLDLLSLTAFRFMTPNKHCAGAFDATKQSFVISGTSELQRLSIETSALYT